MEIIYTLPFPDEICSKIFYYTCKSPHTGLGVSRLKKYLNVKNLLIPDKDLNITNIKAYKIFNLSYYN